MKTFTKYVSVCLFVCISFASNAQLLGSGKIVSKSYDLRDFDAISIIDFDGQLEIEVGKPYSIQVTIDDNLVQRLNVQLQGNLLTLSLLGNENGKLYLEKTNIKIKISMPSAVSFKQSGNSNAAINSIDAQKFLLESRGNGSVNLQGKMNELEINKDGNGNVDASKAIAKTAKVKSLGNGDVKVNSQISLSAHGRGNGNIIQYGTGQIDGFSTVIGNGKLKKA